MNIELKHTRLLLALAILSICDKIKTMAIIISHRRMFLATVYCIVYSFFYLTTKFFFNWLQSLLKVFNVLSEPWIYKIVNWLSFILSSFLFQLFYLLYNNNDNNNNKKENKKKMRNNEIKTWPNLTIFHSFFLFYIYLFIFLLFSLTSTQHNTNDWKATPRPCTPQLTLHDINLTHPHSCILSSTKERKGCYYYYY